MSKTSISGQFIFKTPNSGQIRVQTSNFWSNSRSKLQFLVKFTFKTPISGQIRVQTSNFWSNSHSNLQFLVKFTFKPPISGQIHIQTKLNKALTFARVFTDSESAEAYQNMFTAVFSVVKEDTNSEVCFFHIDGKGIKCVLADAHQGQALGIV